MPTDAAPDAPSAPQLTSTPTAEPAAPTAAPTPAPDPLAPVLAAGDLAAVSAALEAVDPADVGPRSADLQRALGDLDDEPAPGELRRLAVRVGRWLDRGELAGPVGSHVLSLVAELAEQSGEDEDEDDD